MALKCSFVAVLGYDCWRYALRVTQTNGNDKSRNMRFPHVLALNPRFNNGLPFPVIRRASLELHSSKL